MKWQAVALSKARRDVTGRIGLKRRQQRECPLSHTKFAAFVGCAFTELTLVITQFGVLCCAIERQVTDAILRGQGDHFDVMTARSSVLRQGTARF